MFNFMLIEKYNNIWQTDKPKVNSFTGYQSWNIKAWLFTSYARVKREGYTNFLTFIIISLRCSVYRVHTLPSPILYKSDKNQNITAYWFFVLVLLFQVLYIKFNMVCTTPTSTIYIYLWMRGDGADCACCPSLLKEECQTYI